MKLFAEAFILRFSAAIRLNEVAPSSTLSPRSLMGMITGLNSSNILGSRLFLIIPFRSSSRLDLDSKPFLHLLDL
jgi:hypothetical protein